ncbi:MAG: DUF5998 family protein [Bifidobacteriaceae bacterium]|nr:DUF5998 family protein [Bifidobacteriaceae bacterium]
MKISQDDLKARIEATGYFPALVWDVVDTALAGEEIRAHLVHCEPTMSAGAVGSHVTVMVLTPTRMVSTHVDDRVEGPGGAVVTAATTDAVALRAIRCVGVTHMMSDGDAKSRSVTVSIGWGGAARLDLEPAQCSDPSCTADHGYAGSIGADDIVIRVSEEADGPEQLKEALSFARALSKATSVP